ncbi:MAG: diaminopimelate epimerase [Candidatus Zixiibacteriota bacterium]|nr:MAG: diaminopimelate epimerase [candidate division Zixibacteria bacterium]
MYRIKFAKYHALGNDFLVIDLTRRRNLPINFGSLAVNVCRRNSGIGADGILVLTNSRKADCTMDVYNADGSWAERSGNGMRCTAAYLYAGRARKKRIAIETIQGISEAEIIKSEKISFMIRVSVGSPVFETRLIPMKSRHRFHINLPIRMAGVSIPVTVLAVGNPHCVLFIDNFDFDWQTMGSEIENDSAFPNRTNVEFVKIVNRGRIILRDWERGAGATGSSGTGASAAVAAGVVTGLLNRQVEVVFPSGSLFVDWSDNDNIIRLTGPAAFVCRGEYHFEHR